MSDITIDTMESLKIWEVEVSKETQNELEKLAHVNQNGNIEVRVNKSGLDPAWGDIVGYTCQIKNGSEYEVKQMLDECRRHPPRPGTTMISSDKVTWTPIYRTRPTDNSNSPEAISDVMLHMTTLMNRNHQYLRERRLAMEWFKTLAGFLVYAVLGYLASQTLLPWGMEHAIIQNPEAQAGVCFGFGALVTGWFFAGRKRFIRTGKV